MLPNNIFIAMFLWCSQNSTNSRSKATGVLKIDQEISEEERMAAASKGRCL
jgi:hypothetical protein